MKFDRSQPASVPCGTCVACCRDDQIVVRDDEAHKFAWHFEAGRKVLNRKDNGECIYLGKGCAVHDDPPDICRRFDCRVLFLETPKAKRKRRIVENPNMRFVYAAGKARIHTLGRV